MQLKQFLTELGLEDRAAQIYLQLIQMPTPQPASVIARKANMNRTTVYKTLIRLNELGLAAKTMKHGILCFFTDDADRRISQLLEKNKNKLEKNMQNLENVMSQIKELGRHQNIFTPTIRYYEGAEGVQRVYRDSLKERQSICAFENVAHMTPEIHEYIFNDYIPKRAERDIFIQVLAPKNKEHIQTKKNDKKSCRETRFFPEEITPIEIEINMYGNKTAFFSYKKEEMFAIMIESKAVTNSMRSIFDFCWKSAKN